MDFAAIEQCRDDDRKFFNQHLDRDFRLRRAHDCEYTSEPPSGVRLFTVLHRDEVDQCWHHHTFAAPAGFNTRLDDAQIREMLSKAVA